MRNFFRPLRTGLLRVGSKKDSFLNGSRPEAGCKCSSGREEIPLSKIAPGDRIEEPWLKPETKKRFGRSEILGLPFKI